MKIEVLCVGHACYDIIFPMDEFPVENAKYAVSESRESSGGPACNAASLLGLWGVRCAFAGRVGRDLYGRRIAEDLAALGVDTDLLRLDPKGTTPLSCIIAVKGSGSRTIINRKAPGEAFRTTAADFRARFGGEPPKILLFDGHEAEDSLAAMEAFPEAVTILDAGSLRAGTDVLSRKTDFCIASERFAREISGASPSAGAEEALAALTEISRRGAKHAAITVGELGCYYLEDAAGGMPAARHLPALPARAVDTTAAGDIFHGAFAYAALRGYGFADGLRLATAAAGLSTERSGGRDSIPGLRETLDAFRRVESPAVYPEVST